MSESRVEVGGSLEPWVELKDKVVLVTGASSGLGRDFCLDLAKAGCRVIAAARRTDRLQSLCDEINNRVGSTSRAVAVELDIGGSGALVEAAVKTAWNAFGRIDALINNAGVRGQVHTPLDLTEDEWNELMKTNLTGTWVVSKCVGRQMRDGGDHQHLLHRAWPTAGRSCLCCFENRGQCHDQGDGLGIRGVQNKSELYFSWTI